MGTRPVRSMNTPSNNMQTKEVSSHVETKIPQGAGSMKTDMQKNKVTLTGLLVTELQAEGTRD